MRPSFFAFLGLAGLLAVATPALSQTFYDAPNFYYQGPDGTYDSLSDFVRAIHGTPCGIECTKRAEIRWGLAPHQSRGYDRYDRD